MDKKVTRREFARDSVLLSSAALLGLSGLNGEGGATLEKLGQKMPRRTLGRTGLKVPVLGLGGGSVFMQNTDAVKKKMFDRAMELGVSFIDTAQCYSRGMSEKFFGEMATKHRDKMVIQTKLDTRTKSEAEAELKGCFENLKTDYIDIMLVHLITDDEDIDVIADGVWSVMEKAKKKGAVGHIGFSLMKGVDKGVEFVNRLDPDVMLVALPPDNYYGAEDVLLPLAKKNDMGVMAMKVIRKWLEKHPDEVTPTSANELLESAYSMKDVHSIIIGHVGVKQLEENAAIARTAAQAAGMGTLESTQARTELRSRLREWAGPDFHDWGNDDYLDNGYPYRGKTFA